MLNLTASAPFMSETSNSHTWLAQLSQFVFCCCSYLMEDPNNYTCFCKVCVHSVSPWWKTICWCNIESKITHLNSASIWLWHSASTSLYNSIHVVKRKILTLFDHMLWCFDYGKYSNFKAHFKIPSRCLKHCFICIYSKSCLVFWKIEIITRIQCLWL